VVEQVSVHVREALPQDYEAIGALTVAAYAAFPEMEGDDEYARELRDVAARSRDCPIYAALDGDGRVIGGAMYVPGPGNRYAEAERDGEAGIRMLAVSPEAQGKGAGRALLDALIARARTDGRRGMALMTIDSMSAAHRLYAKTGFRREPERDWEYEPGFTLRCFAVAFDELDDADAASAAPPRDGA
jgi:GNAT superfamily N-acetyltransferase